MFKKFSVELDARTADRITENAKDRDMSRNSYMKRIIRYYMARHADEFEPVARVI